MRVRKKKVACDCIYCTEHFFFSLFSPLLYVVCVYARSLIHNRPVKDQFKTQLRWWRISYYVTQTVTQNTWNDKWAQKQWKTSRKQQIRRINRTQYWWPPSEHQLSNYMELFRAAIYIEGKFGSGVFVMLIKDLFGFTWKGSKGVRAASKIQLEPMRLYWLLLCQQAVPCWESCFIFLHLSYFFFLTDFSTFKHRPIVWWQHIQPSVYSLLQEMVSAIPCLATAFNFNAWIWKD